jgi:hypothetical protein
MRQKNIDQLERMHGAHDVKQNETCRWIKQIKIAQALTDWSACMERMTSSRVKRMGGSDNQNSKISNSIIAFDSKKIHTGLDFSRTWVDFAMTMKFDMGSTPRPCSA